MEKSYRVLPGEYDYYGYLVSGSLRSVAGRIATTN